MTERCLEIPHICGGHRTEALNTAFTSEVLLLGLTDWLVVTFHLKINILSMVALSKHGQNKICCYIDENVRGLKKSSLHLYSRHWYLWNNFIFNFWLFFLPNPSLCVLQGMCVGTRVPRHKLEARRQILWSQLSPFIWLRQKLFHFCCGTEYSWQMLKWFSGLQLHLSVGALRLQMHSTISLPHL